MSLSQFGLSTGPTQANIVEVLDGLVDALPNLEQYLLLGIPTKALEFVETNSI